MAVSRLMMDGRDDQRSWRISFNKSAAGWSLNVAQPRYDMTTPYRDTTRRREREKDEPADMMHCKSSNGHRHRFAASLCNR